MIKFDADGLDRRSYTVPEFTQVAKVFHLGSQSQIHLCRRVQKPVRVMLGLFLQKCYLIPDIAS